jgi:starch phosphorylase
MVRMAYLAIVGSFSVNGVAALHSRLLTEGLFHDFFELWPEKFNNKTNGVTPRRWLAWCNPGLRELISEKLGDGWVADLEQLRRLEPLAEDPAFRTRWHEVKLTNKRRLAAMVEADCGVVFNPEALFDVQVKRIHEYKRQLLNVLHVIHLYDRLKRGDTADWTDRCVLVGGKAAPGYAIAKSIIKLVNNVAGVVNDDPDVGGRLKVAFLPNYRVTAMEVIAPGSDLSEQISTAGKEASGTGNMKFMMNGAVTIGTLDGANIEIREEVGEENFFLFGLTAEEVHARKAGGYDPAAAAAGDPELTAVLDLIRAGHFSPEDPGLFTGFLDGLLKHDEYLLFADFADYAACQRRVAERYRDSEWWTRAAILNLARMGKFSSDRTIAEYNREVWKTSAVPVSLADAT